MFVMYHWETRYRCPEIFIDLQRHISSFFSTQIIVAQLTKKNERWIVNRENKKNTVPVEQSFWNKVCPFVGKRKFYCAVMKTYRAVKDSFFPHLSKSSQLISKILIRSRFVKISRNFLLYSQLEHDMCVILIRNVYKTFLHYIYNVV